MVLTGVAGSGKSTVCQYLLRHARWVWPDNDFDTVFYLRLQALATTLTQHPKTTLADGVAQHALLMSLTPKETAQLAAYLTIHRHRIAWLLDGHDELDPNNKTVHAWLARHLFTQPYVLLTRRPTTQPIPGFRVDQKITQTGFTTPHQQWDYLQRFFANAPDQATALWAFCQRQPALRP